jgi:hypothetical protein
MERCSMDILIHTQKSFTAKVADLSDIMVHFGENLYSAKVYYK